VLKQYDGIAIIDERYQMVVSIGEVALCILEKSKMQKQTTLEENKLSTFL
jgi:hypothetical protein